MSGPVAVYLHTPFCPSKCGYCDFNSYAMDGPIVERTVAAIETEILRSPHRGRPAKTVFFGGGTPTFLNAGQLHRLLAAVTDAHPLVTDAEVTSEANPGTVDWPKFRAMREAGFNRISLGAQSFDSGDLLRLGRVHEAGHVGRAVAAAREAGFDNVNLDLMFGLPGQARRAWRTNIDLAIGLRPDHLSLYCLTIEPNTRFYRHHLRGTLNLPDDDEQVAMYDEAVAACAAHGYAQYEISNFARPGRESRHNLCYWRGEEYVAYGPGAVGCTAGPTGRRVRSTNAKHPERYAALVESGGRLWCDQETLDDEARRLERVMLGIRLNEGLPTAGLDLDARALARLAERGWVETDGARVRLTPAGRHFCTEVAVSLV